MLSVSCFLFCLLSVSVCFLFAFSFCLLSISSPPSSHPFSPPPALRCMRCRWSKVLNPSVVKGSWTPEEDAAVAAFATAADKSKKVRVCAGVVYSRFVCFLLFSSSLPSFLAWLRFSFNLFSLSPFLTLQHPYTNQQIAWAIVAKQLPGRIGKQVRPSPTTSIHSFLFNSINSTSGSAESDGSTTSTPTSTRCVRLRMLNTHTHIHTY